MFENLQKELKDLIAYRQKITNLVDTLIERYQAVSGLEELSEMRGLDVVTLVAHEIFKVPGMDFKIYCEELEIKFTEYHLLSEKDNSFLHGGRWIIPIRDLNDDIKFLTSYEKGKAAKYLTSRFKYHNKEGSIYGNLIKIREKRKALICEGFFDKMTLYELGYIDIALALLGVNFTEEKLVLLNNLEFVVILVDNDKTGRRSALEWSKNNIPCALLQIKGLKDVNDFYKTYKVYGKSEIVRFKAMIDNLLETRTIGYFEFIPEKLPDPPPMTFIF